MARGPLMLVENLPFAIRSARVAGSDHARRQTVYDVAIICPNRTGFAKHTKRPFAGIRILRYDPAARGVGRTWLPARIQRGALAHVSGSRGASHRRAGLRTSSMRAIRPTCCS